MSENEDLMDARIAELVDFVAEGNSLRSLLSDEELRALVAEVARRHSEDSGRCAPDSERVRQVVHEITITEIRADPDAGLPFPVADAIANRVAAQLAGDWMRDKRVQRFLDVTGPLTEDDVVIRLSLGEVRALVRCRLAGPKLERTVARGVINRLSLVVDGLPKEAK